MKAYQHIKTNEIIEVDESLEYIYKKLGIKIEDQNTLEQEEFKQMIQEWYFSGDWIEVEVEV